MVFLSVYLFRNRRFSPTIQLPADGAFVLARQQADTFGCQAGSGFIIKEKRRDEDLQDAIVVVIGGDTVDRGCAAAGAQVYQHQLAVSGAVLFPCLLQRQPYWAHTGLAG